MSDETWEELVDKPFPRTPLETPVPNWLLENDHRLPETELQALMETEPNGVPQTSKQQLAESIQRVEQIVENDLSEEERAVIEVTVFAGHSIRKAAEILGWPRSTVQRLKVSAIRIIEREMRDDAI